MFLLLTQVLLWLLITFILYNVLLRLVPKAYFTLLGGVFLFAVIVLAFFFPNDPVVSAAWRVLSFPLKPLGFSLLLLAIALRMGLKDSKNLVMSALVILLVFSTPLIASLMAQGTANVANSEPQRQETIQLATNFAAAPISTSRADTIVTQASLNGVSSPTGSLRLAQFGPEFTQRIPIRVESFIPSVDALVVSTQIWENFLASVYYLLRGLETPPAGAPPVAPPAAPPI